MMMRNKVSLPVEVELDQKAWLEEMAKKHGLADPSKVLRVLVDFARMEGDEEKIFGEIRCSRCG